MTITKVIAYLITIAMVSTILWAQNQVSLFDSILPTLPWGVVSLVDLYSGFILIGIWIIYKENSLPAIFWIIFLILHQAQTSKAFYGRNQQQYLLQ